MKYLIRNQEIVCVCVLESCQRHEEGNQPKLENCAQLKKSGEKKSGENKTKKIKKGKNKQNAVISDFSYQEIQKSIRKSSLYMNNAGQEFFVVVLHLILLRRMNESLVRCIVVPAYFT